MELALFVWAAEVLPSLGGVFVFLGIVLGCLSTLVFAVTLEDRGEERLNSIAKVGTIVSTVILLLGILIPSQKTMYLMAGAYGAQSVATSDAGRRVVKILENKLDDILKEQEEKLKK